MTRAGHALAWLVLIAWSLAVWALVLSRFVGHAPTPTAAPVIAAPPHALSPNPLSRP